MAPARQDHLPTFRLTIERIFSAAHALKLRGVMEHLHGHDWKVTVTVEGRRLDDDGLLCDFHELEVSLDQVIQPFRNCNLNETSAFSDRNPSAELVAEYIAKGLAGSPAWTGGVRLLSVQVTEAPGCTAVYLPADPI